MSIRMCPRPKRTPKPEGVAIIAFRPPAQPAPAPPSPPTPPTPPAPPTTDEPDEADLSAIAREVIDDRCARLADLIARADATSVPLLRWHWLRLRYERAAIARSSPTHDMVTTKRSN